MNRVLKTNKKTWIKIKNKFSKKLMTINKNNSKFRTVLKEIIKDKNTL